MQFAINNALEKSKLLRENRMYQKHLETLVQERTSEIKKMNQELSNINIRLQNIVKSTQGFSSCTNIDQFGLKMLHEFAKNMDATGGSFYLIEKKGLRLLHCIEDNHQPSFINFPLKEGSLINRALRKKEPILIENINEEKP